MSATQSNTPPDVTIRWALPADLPALERVAGRAAVDRGGRGAGLGRPLDSRRHLGRRPLRPQRRSCRAAPHPRKPAARQPAAGAGPATGATARTAALSPSAPPSPLGRSPIVEAEGRSPLGRSPIVEAEGRSPKRGAGLY